MIREKERERERERKRKRVRKDRVREEIREKPIQLPSHTVRRAWQEAIVKRELISNF